MFRSRNRLAPAFVLAVFMLSACNMPGRGTPTQSAASIIYTAAARTVQAQLTEVSQPHPTSIIGTNAPFPTVTEPAQTAIPGNTATSPAGRTPTPGTGTPVACDQAKLVEDITYPDNTDVAPGTTFVKTWRLQNAGSCTWTSAYAIVFSGGEAMGAPASVPVTSGTVAPGEKVDVSVTLKSPDSAGRYRGDWKLRNASNQIFGLGKDNKPFWVQIQVVTATGLVYDFLAKASSATWVSGVGNDLNTPVTFGGADDDPNGAAKIVDQVPLETGATSAKVLLTAPKHAEDGVISGTFPEYTVQPGDHLKAGLGLMAPGGSCDEGRVRFRINYKEGNNTQSLDEWRETCDGSLARVDIDLTSLAGKKVQFVLVVTTDGPFQDDWAIWNSLRIEH